MQDGYHRTSAPRRRDLRRRLVLPGRLPAHRRRFSLPDGRTVETQSSWGTNPPAAKPGAQVTVLYDLSDPTSASLPAGGTSAVVSGVIIALGGILIAVGLAAAAFLAVVL